MLMKVIGSPADAWELWVQAIYSAIFCVGQFFLYCYLDQIVKHSEGRTRPVWFAFTKAFWSSVCNQDPLPARMGIEGGNDTNLLNANVEENLKTKMDF